MVKSYFSAYARNRLDELMLASIEYITELLDNEISIPFGQEKGTSRVHHLIYSNLDHTCFVAVRDSENGEIITVLPLQFLNKWMLDPGLISQIRNKTIKYLDKAKAEISTLETKSCKKDPDYKSPKFHVKIWLETETRKKRIIPLRLCANETRINLQSIMNGCNDAILDAMIIDSVKKNISPEEFCSFILIHSGSKGCPQSYPVPEIPQ
jgi:hypothetical protein